jgi:hypothetical protein
MHGSEFGEYRFRRSSSGGGRQQQEMEENEEEEEGEYNAQGCRSALAKPRKIPQKASKIKQSLGPNAYVGLGQRCQKCTTIIEL